jgi:methionine salvage enolase-phosphatase E1
MGSDERDLRLDRRSLEKRFKDVAPLKMARLKTAQAIGDKVDKSQLKEETLDEALPAHLAKLFDKDGNFKDPKKQKIFDRMMGDGIGKEIAQKMGRIQFRVDADSRNKKIKVYVDSNDETDAQRALKNHPAYISGALRVIPEEVELEEGKMKQLHDLISQGKSAQQIAKMLKLDVKTIQALMDETINKDSIVSEKVTPYVYNSFNEFVVHHGDKEETDTSTIKERALTKFELKKREKIAKDLPDAEFKKRYGDDWMNVKMGTATNMAKGES